MVSYDVKALFTSNLQSLYSKNRLQQDPLSHRTSMSISQIISLLEFCNKKLTSSPRVIILNRSMAQPWVPPSAPSLLTFSLKSSSEVKAIHSAPSLFYDSVMQKVHLSLNRQNIVISSSSISTPRTHTSNSPWKAKGRWLHILPGYPCFSGTQQCPNYISLQKTNPNRSIPPMEQ